MLTQGQAAHRLNVTPAVLAALHARGEGPTYTEAAIEKWLGSAANRAALAAMSDELRAAAHQRKKERKLKRRRAAGARAGRAAVAMLLLVHPNFAQGRWRRAKRCV